MGKIKRRIIDVTLDTTSDNPEQETINAVGYVQYNPEEHGRRHINSLIEDLDSEKFYYYTKESNGEAEVVPHTPKDPKRNRYVSSVPNETKKDNLLTIARKGSIYGTKDDK